MTDRVVRLRGEIDMAGSAAMRRKFAGVLAEGTENVVLDCTDVGFMNSSGIAVMIELRNGLEFQHRRLRVRNVPPLLGRAIDVLGLAEFLGAAPRSGVVVSPSRAFVDCSDDAT